MKLNTYLAHRLKEILTEGTWVTGINFKAQILDLHWREAIKKIDHLNTIADLTFHIHYYIEGVIKVLEGGPLEIKDAYSFDAPPIKTEADWKSLVHKFCSDSEKIISLVGNMTDDNLLSNFANKNYGHYYRNIDVIIEHTYYHLGQVLLIKKLLSNH